MHSHTEQRARDCVCVCYTNTPSRPYQTSPRHLATISIHIYIQPSSSSSSSTAKRCRASFMSIVVHELLQYVRISVFIIQHIYIYIRITRPYWYICIRVYIILIQMCACDVGVSGRVCVDVCICVFGLCALKFYTRLFSVWLSFRQRNCCYLMRHSHTRFVRSERVLRQLTCENGLFLYLFCIFVRHLLLASTQFARIRIVPFALIRAWICWNEPTLQILSASCEICNFHLVFVVVVAQFIHNFFFCIYIWLGCGLQWAQLRTEIEKKTHDIKNEEIYEQKVWNKGNQMPTEHDNQFQQIPWEHGK